jgi:mono/diheme cytochrome c family protein
MKYLGKSIVGILLSAALPVAMIAGSAQQPHEQKPQKSTAPAANPDRGQQVFEQNCARCHNTPEGFSPRISGTVAMHMRVRAGLSEADYQALRRFLNP